MRGVNQWKSRAGPHNNYLARGSGAKYRDENVCVCLSVCLSVRDNIPGTTRAMFTKFSMHVAYGRVSVLLKQGDDIPRGTDNFWGCPGHSKALAIFAAAIATAFAAKWIIKSPITSCSRKDHSVCQASANRNPENPERRRCCLSAGKG